MKDYFQSKWRLLHEIRAEPEAVAGGVAIGTFMGFMPFIGLKTLLAIAVAWIARCSKMAAVIAVTLHDVSLLFAPFLIWVEFHLGTWILGRPRTDIIPKLPGHFWQHWGSFWNWEFFNRYVTPILIGSIMIAIPFAIASYFIVHGLLVRMRRHRECAEAAAKAAGAAVNPDDI